MNISHYQKLFILYIEALKKIMFLHLICGKVKIVLQRILLVLFIFNIYLEKPKVHPMADRLDRITDVDTYKQNKLSIIMP